MLMEKNPKYFNKNGKLKAGYIMDYSGDTPKISRLSTEERKQIIGKVRMPTDDESMRIENLARRAGIW
jgi:hypothetical protein